MVLFPIGAVEEALQTRSVFIGALSFLVVLVSGKAWPQQKQIQDPAVLLAQTDPAIVALAGAESGASGYEWQLDDLSVPTRKLTLLALTLPAAAVEWQVVPVARRGRSADLLRQLPCADPWVLTSGGFYGRDAEGKPMPLWLSIAGGRVLSPFVGRRYGGVMARKPGQTRTHIFPVRQFPHAEPWAEALQSSPLIVDQGRNDMHRDDGKRFNRLAIGLDAAGNLMILGAFRANLRAVSLYAFAEIALAVGQRIGFDLEQALALDGGPSARIYLPGSGRFWGYGGRDYLPNGLCFRPPKAESAASTDE